MVTGGGEGDNRIWSIHCHLIAIFVYESWLADNWIAHCQYAHIGSSIIASALAVLFNYTWSATPMCIGGLFVAQNFHCAYNTLAGVIWCHCIAFNKVEFYLPIMSEIDKRAYYPANFIWKVIEIVFRWESKCCEGVWISSYCLKDWVVAAARRGRRRRSRR